ncbi:MAG: class I SAM-dependent methyltransferase [Gammaproteobacteria bacterium]|nr:class I SAM-dependent methyltransferase [Gammaproteobacteria bacterium]
MTNVDFQSVTELAGDEVTSEQVERICHRYTWAASYCEGRDVLEVACGTGQGLGYLASVANSLVAGDFSESILDIARHHYGERIALRQFDAQQMPYDDASLDVVILFEALYYIPDADRFVAEARRVLRPGGQVLIATANKDLFDFNPSPFSHTYYGVVDLGALFSRHGFATRYFGHLPIREISGRQKLLRPIKRAVVALGLMPKTMAGKKLLKRLVFGKLIPMPAEVRADMFPFEPPLVLPDDRPDTQHKVIYCAATLS